MSLMEASILGHLHILSGWTGTFHRCPEPGLIRVIFSTLREPSGSSRCGVDQSLQQDSRPWEVGFASLIARHLYLEQSLDRQMPQEEQVLREKLARLSLSQCPHLPAFPPRLPGSQWPGSFPL